MRVRVTGVQAIDASVPIATLAVLCASVADSDAADL
jgi:hypothetical protein